MKLARREFLATVAVTVAGLSACTEKVKEPAPAPAPPQEPERVLLLLKTLDNEFFKDIESGFREAWKSPLELDVLGGKNESDTPAQRNALDSYLRNFVRGRGRPLLRGLVLAPSDSGSGLLPEIAELRKAGVPVILVDTAISAAALREANTDYNILLASDNLLGGELAGGVLKEALVGKRQPRVLVLNGPNEHETARLRRQGFLSVASSAGWKITERTANWRQEEARLIVDSFRIARQVPDAIFAANDNMAIGAIEALRMDKKPLPLIVGFDATSAARELIKQKELFATIEQLPKLMGMSSAEELQKIISGASAPNMKSVPVPVRVVR